MTPLQQAVAQMAKNAGIDDIVMEASNHNYRCRCDKCLQWWVACGPEDNGEGWSYGPFTEAEFVAAGGKVPPYVPDDEDAFAPFDGEDGEDW